MNFKIHPAANIFPMMGDAEYKKLVEDIRENGVQHPVTLIGEERETSLILDGRNRARAMVELGIEVSDHADSNHPDDIKDPIAYVLSANLHRRHLTEGQLGLIGTNVANLRRGGDRSKPTIVGLKTSSKTIAAAAAEVGVSGKTVERARKVKATAVADIVAAVQAGTISLSAASEVAKLDKPQQQAVIDAGPKAVVEKAAEIRKKPHAPLVEKEKPAGKSPQPFPELREMFDTMEKPDEQAVTRFVVWAMKLSDANQVMGGCSLWLDWSRKDGGVPQ